MALQKSLDSIKANPESAKACKKASKAYTQEIADKAIANTEQPHWR